ncbi:hypothetical protein [Microbacterium panaciterrae]|uniref:Uncharacterized protein n=1 Tax=Microbacterium panaciterrae TaxID=985759 RepID=A0ABP8PUL0_9MICO
MVRKGESLDPRENDESAELSAATQWTDDDRREWVQLSYNAGLETLKAQREEIAGMRQRAIMFTAFTITATGFLVGTGLSTTAKTGAFFAWATVGTVLFGILAALLVALVAPLIQFKFVLLPDALMRWLEGTNPAPSRLIALRQLALVTVPGMVKFNRQRLSVARWFYRGVLVSAVLTLACWVTVVWMFAQ